METANGQNMYKPRPLEIVPQCLGNAAPVARQQA